MGGKELVGSVELVGTMDGVTVEGSRTEESDKDMGIEVSETI